MRKEDETRVEKRMVERDEGRREEGRKEGKIMGRKVKERERREKIFGCKTQHNQRWSTKKNKLTVCTPTSHPHRGWDPAFPSQSRPSETLPDSCVHPAGAVQGTGTALWLPMGFHSSHMTCCTGQWEAYSSMVT